MRTSRFVLLSLLSLGLVACSDAYAPNQQGTKLEDRQQNKDMQFSSPLPNGSPNTPPSEMSASPNGSSLGNPPQF